MQDNRTLRRLQVIQRHFTESPNSGHIPLKHSDCAGESRAFRKGGQKSEANADTGMGDALPNPRQKLTKWNGWGYKDTEFLLGEDGDCYITGSDRYVLSGQVIPLFRPWFEKFCGLDSRFESPAQSWEQMRAKIIPPNIYQPFFDAVKQVGECYKYMTHDDEVRLLHAHGHSCQEIFQLRYGKFKRLPDVVIYPGEHKHVERLVKLASQFSKHVTIIPYGGGTTVSQSLMCPENENRMIISLDMQEMNRVLHVDRNSNFVVIEAGAVGTDIQEKLCKEGLVLGHEPDSVEFSSLGGWVATRASGMKKNVYGNIEDLVINIKFVTAKGTVHVGCNVPRKSTGPDTNEMIMGSEGTLGVVTEVTLKVRKLPGKIVYGSVVFPDFESGVACMHEVANKRQSPASIRLIDNSQFQFGQALKPKNDSIIDHATEWFKKIYVTKIMGFNPDTMCVMSLLFEGEEDQVNQQEKAIYSIASKYGGLKAGPENGIRAYLLTYVIAYLRDYGFRFYFMAESFETSVPWTQVIPLVNNVKKRIMDSAKKKGCPVAPWVSARVTQTYDTGAAVYFYFGFIFRGLKNPVRIFSEVEAEARDEILANGGSLSHHHGVGKLRKDWMVEAVSQPGFDMIKGLKQAMDPDNLFGNGNMGVTEASVSVSEDVEK